MVKKAVVTAHAVPLSGLKIAPVKKYISITPDQDDGSREISNY